MDLDADPVMSELERIISDWPGASYVKVISDDQRDLSMGTADFPTGSASSIVLSVVALSGDFYDISVKCKSTGRIVWSEIWEMSMKSLPDGTPIRSPATFAEFGSARIRLLLFSEWVLLVDDGWVLRQKYLLVRSGDGWRVDSRRTWLGSGLVGGRRTSAYHHAPSEVGNT